MKHRATPQQKPPHGKKTPSRLLAGILPTSGGALRRDLIAGVTLAAAAIPIDMGYTKIAGMPIASGLYILLLPTVAFALLGASRHLVVGADSASAAILAAAMIPLAAAGSSQYAGFVCLLTLMVGLLLLLCRLFRLGFIANFLSRTVLTGFLCGIGIQVAISQGDDLLGLPAVTGSTLQKIAGFASGLSQTNLAALAVSVLAFSLVFVPKLFYKKFPALRRVPFGLVAILGSLLAGWLLPSGTFGMVGAVQGGLPPLTLPTASFDAILSLAGPCIAITVVIITQSAATAQVYATRYEETLHPNQDIFAMGAANIAAAFTGAFVTNGSPTKTEIANESGAKSQVANLTTAAVVLFVLLFFTSPLQYIPTAALAAVVLSASLGLVDLRTLRKIAAFSKGEFFIALATALVVVLVGAAQGILLAMILSLLDHVKKSYQPHSRILLATPAGAAWQDAATSDETLPDVVLYRFGASLYYANAGKFLSDVHRLVQRAPALRELSLDFSAISSIDYSGCETLWQVVRLMQEKGIALAVVFLSQDVSATLEKSGLAKAIGKKNLYPTLQDYVQRRGLPSGFLSAGR